MYKIRPLPATLLEIIIVMTILLLGAGIAGININKALVEQRFRSEVGIIVDELRLAQNLMLILGTDVHLHFEVDQSGKSISYKLELETALPKNVQYEIMRKREPLKTIKGVFLADELVTEIKEKHIDIKFLSNGAVMSKGILRLASSDNENVPKGTLESFICLAGYPKPISSNDTKEEAEKNCLKFEQDLDARLTQDTSLRIPEKLKQPDPASSNNSSEEKNANQEKDKKPSEKPKEAEK